MKNNKRPTKILAVALALSLSFTSIDAVVNTTPVAAETANGSLEVGDSGPRVAEVQRLLLEHGTDANTFFLLKVDGDYGSKTKFHVETFQRWYGLEVDGLVGPSTLQQLRGPVQYLRLGSEGEAVRRLQERLDVHLDRSIVADGDFGPATEAAVREFQRSQGLEADGIVGAQTLNAAYDRVNSSVSRNRAQISSIAQTYSQTLSYLATPTPPVTAQMREAITTKSAVEVTVAGANCSPTEPATPFTTLPALETTFRISPKQSRTTPAYFEVPTLLPSLLAAMKAAHSQASRGTASAISQVKKAARTVLRLLSR